MHTLTLQTVDFEKLDKALRYGKVVLWGSPGVEGEHCGPAKFSLSYNEGMDKPYAVEIEEWSGWMSYPDSRDEPGFVGWELLDHPWCKARLLCDAIGWLQTHEYPLPPDYSFTQEYRIVERDVIAFGPRFVPTWGGTSLSEIVSRMPDSADEAVRFLGSIGLTPERYEAVLKERIGG
jgi:hypothetical protein